MNAYDFDRQLSKGEAAERLLDDYFGAIFEIERVSRSDQRRGIDRIFTRRDDGSRETVEYKTDWWAERSGNAFVETVSVDIESKPGWVHTCQADRLFYYVPGYELVYVFRPSDLRSHITTWQRVFPTRKAQNDGYATHGVLVPLSEFERCALEVVSL